MRSQVIIAFVVCLIFAASVAAQQELKPVSATDINSEQAYEPVGQPVATSGSRSYVAEDSIDLAPIVFSYSDLIMLLICCLFPALVAYFLAKEKGRNVLNWTILSLIPGLNFFTLLYLVGTPDITISLKVTHLINIIEADKSTDNSLLSDK